MLGFRTGACYCASVQQRAVFPNTQDCPQSTAVMCGLGKVEFWVFERVVGARCRQGGVTEVFTWTDAEAGDNPDDAAHTDVAHEGQPRLRVVRDGS